MIFSLVRARMVIREVAKLLRVWCACTLCEYYAVTAFIYSYSSYRSTYISTIRVHISYYFSDAIAAATAAAGDRLYNYIIRRFHLFFFSLRCENERQRP